MSLPKGIAGDASPRGDSEYRHWLSRTWSKKGKLALVIAINPSTATAERDDDMTRFLTELLRGLEGEYKCGGYSLVNCCDIRSSKPESLKRMQSICSSANSEIIQTHLENCDFVVASWGTSDYGPDVQRLRDDVETLVAGSGKPVICFSPTGKPIYCSQRNANSVDKRWSKSPVPWQAPLDTGRAKQSTPRRAASRPPRKSATTNSAPKTRRAAKRTKRRIAQDIATVLNAPEGWLSLQAQKAVFNNAIWAWTQYEGKYEGCSWWSLAAMRLSSQPRRKLLVHEHAVPRKVLVEMFWNLSKENPGTVTVDAVLALCEKYVHAVIVTKDEDQLLNDRGLRQRMPDAFYTPASDCCGEPFARYNCCGIKLVEPVQLRPARP